MLLALFVAGLLVGRRRLGGPWSVRAARALVPAAVAVVVGLMGIRIGADPALLGRLPVLGGKAAAFALSTVIGSIAAAALARRYVELP